MSAIIKTEAIVLRHAQYRDYDRMLTLFSGEHGLLNANAPACRRARSPLLASSQLFCYGQYELNNKRDRLTVKQCAVSESFYALGTNLDAFSHGVYYLNFCEAVVQRGEGNMALFTHLIKCLTLLLHAQGGHMDITNYFILNALSILGLQPEMDACVHCADPISDAAFFHVQDGGLICKKCAVLDRNREAAAVSGAAVYALRFLLSARAQSLATFQFTPKLRSEVSALVRAYVQARLEQKLRAQSFIDRLEQLSEDK